MNKSIVINFLGDFFFDARCINMADTIIDLGLDLHIIDTGNSNNKYRGKLIQHITVRKKGILRYIKFYFESKKIIKRIKPQHIIAADIYSLPASVSIKTANVVYDSREIYTQLGGLSRQRIKQYFWSIVEKIFINKINTVLVTAKGDASILNQLYNNLKLITIYNYPSIKMLPKTNNILKNKLNIVENDIIFLYQGVLLRGRGIKSMIQLLKYFSNAHVVIIGDGPYKNEIKKFAVHHNLINKIYLLGSIPYKEMFDLTKGADIGFSLIKPISESYRQALPNKIFEYVLCNVPVIASDLPEMDFIINKYKLGYSVPYNEIDKQKEAIRKLLNEKNYHLQNIASKYFTWEKQKNKFLMTLNMKDL